MALVVVSLGHGTGLGDSALGGFLGFDALLGVALAEQPELALLGNKALGSEALDCL